MMSEKLSHFESEPNHGPDPEQAERWMNSARELTETGSNHLIELEKIKEQIESQMTEGREPENLRLTLSGFQELIAQVEADQAELARQQRTVKEYVSAANSIDPK